jgi:hypothetical protein
MLVIVPFVRGSAVLLFGFIIFLSYFHYWKYQNIKSALMLLSTIFFIALAIHYSLSIRPRYLLEWQYSRIMPDVTIHSLMIILYLVPLLFMLMLAVFNMEAIKNRFKKINLPFVIIIFIIFFRIIVAYIFSIKKNMDFLDLLIFNEWGVVQGNLGFILACLVVTGLLFMYYKAARGDEKILVLLVLYTIFYIPFTMQEVSFSKDHAILLYWSRYYFSEILIFHIASLAILTRLFYHYLLHKVDNNLLRKSLFTVTLAAIFLVSVNKKLLYIVSTEGYLTNASSVFSFLKDKKNLKNTSVIYSEDIHFGIYRAKQLLHKGFYVLGIRPVRYWKFEEGKLDTPVKIPANVARSNTLLCLSASKCRLDADSYILIDSLNKTIMWREHDPENNHNAMNVIKMNVSLYRIKNK